MPRSSKRELIAIAIIFIIFLGVWIKGYLENKNNQGLYRVEAILNIDTDKALPKKLMELQIEKLNERNKDFRFVAKKECTQLVTYSDALLFIFLSMFVVVWFFFKEETSTE